MTDSIRATDNTALSASATGAATTSDATFSADFETFLTLLTTQLTQQDPLSPMDSDKFTQQLVQYSQVEQSIKTNSNLEQMLESMQADRLTSSLDYVGQWVEIDGDTATLGAEGDATLNYSLPQDASKSSLTISNERGETVARFDLDGTAGANSFTWNGLGADGQREPPGIYEMRVDAFDNDDQPIDVSSSVGGIVDGVERSGEDIALIVNGRAYAIESVRSVSERRAAA